MTNTPLDLPRQLDLEELIAHEAHDLRSPYNLIIGFSKMLQSEPGPSYPPELQHADAEAIYRAGQRALLLMNSLIDIARLNRHEKEASPDEIGIKSLVEQSLAFWKKFNLTSTLQTQSQLNTTTTLFTADEALVRPTLCSFIMVVAQHIDPEATVTLTVDEEPEWLVFKVAGAGKKAQPFSKLDLQMQGYLGRALVELQQGELRTAEETDDGAVIQFALPRTSVAATDAGA
jgi:K+-sensing histidine kinase KdpD